MLEVSHKGSDEMTVWDMCCTDAKRFLAEERGDYSITSVATFGAVILPLAMAFFYAQDALGVVYEKSMAIISLPYP